MPPRPDELPEGTDHIINGAMETGGADDGGAGGTGGSTGGAAASTGGIETGGASGLIGATGGDDTGGSAAGGGAGGGGDAAGGVVEQLRSQAFALRDQAGGRVREFADGGKTRASDALEELSRVVADAADSIDERLGREYGEYARKAADAVSGFADTLRTTEVDEIYGNVESAVRKSPGVALGVAAVLGFTLTRLVKSGLDGATGGGTGGSGGSGAGTTGGTGGTGGASGA
jgi:ElaB/YqjD/DUF883 family membrane-anchored ribosome-binding protein